MLTNKYHILSILLLCTVMVSAQIRPPKSNEEVDIILRNAEQLKNQNDIIAADSELKRANIVAEKNKDNKGLVNIFNQYAIFYLDQGDKKNAAFMLEMSQMKTSKLVYPYGDAKRKSIEALLYLQENKIHGAKALLFEARQQSNNRNLLNHIILYEGMIYLKEGKYRAAKKNFSALTANEDKIHKAILRINGYYNLAKVNMAEEDYSNAVKNSKLAYEYADLNNFVLKKLQAGDLLSEAYEKLEDYKSALHYSHLNSELKDTIFKVEDLRIKEQVIYDSKIESLQSQLKQQIQVNTEASQRVGLFKITAILTTGFLIIISLLAISLFRTNQIKVSTNDLLVRKNKELIIARDEAEKAMQAKTQFLSTVSHELRTPLYAVTGLTHLLLEENPSESQKEHLKSLKFSGDYLLAFINDILQINKIEADKLDIEKNNFSLHKLLSEVVLSLQQTAKEKNTQVILEIDKTIPNTLIGDTVKLSQVMINLVGNALKFTSDGKVTILAKLLEKTKEHSKVYFEVKDTGIGISEEMQSNIFESFEQGSIQINRKYGGTGLGLTIVKSLLSMFDSEIRLHSKLGEGSSFFFDINFDNSIEDEQEQTKIIETDENALEGLHMLLVEDNKINQVITSKMLLKKGITSDIANNGYEAIDLAKSNNYDGILMDIHMPGISGVVATEEIRKFNTEIPIIALTAISLDDSTEHFYLAGCNDVVTKPFKPEIFYQRIAENVIYRINNKPETTIDITPSEEDV